MLAEQYAKTFRVWPMRQDKTPLAPGFGADHPNATWNPARIPDEMPCGILCGPFAPGSIEAGEGWHVLGLDLDKAMTREKLEDALGVKLPETLTSKGWRHAYYLIPDDHPLHQRNKAITCEGGALDIRPTAGGYLIEKNQWDRGFDPSLMAMFPEEALAKLAQFIGEKRAATGAPPELAPIQLSDRDAEIARDLASIWQHETKGDRAFGGLGGWLARRGVARDRAEAIAGKIAELTDSDHVDPVERVGQAYDEGNCPLGRPALQAALAENAEEALVQVILDDLEDKISSSVAGFRPKAEAETEPGKRHGLRILSSADLRVELPPVEWLCRDLQLAPGRPPVVAATASAGKSWGIQCAAMAVCKGSPIFGRFPVQTPGPVVHVCTDSGERATQRRYQLIGRAMGFEVPDNLYVIPDRITGLVDKYGQFQKAGLRGLSDLVDKINPRLVILDSMFAIVAGLDMSAPQAGAPLYATKDDTRVWLWTMHIPKQGGDYFGSAAIGAACGVMWGIDKSEREDDARIWTCKKRSEDFEGASLQTFATVWRTEQDEDDHLISGQVLVVDDEPEAQGERPELEVRRLVLNALTRFPMLSQGQLLKQLEGVTLRKQSKVQVIQSLVEAGNIVQGRSGTQSFSYSLGTRDLDPGPSTGSR